MKKIFLALSLAAVLPLFFACSKSNAGNENTFEEPRFIQYAGQLVPKGGAAPQSLHAMPAFKAGPLAAYSGQIVSIELTESGLYVVAVKDANGNISYKGGNFTVSGNVYTLTGFGEIEFNNTNAGAVEVTIRPTGADAFVWQATLKKTVTTNPLHRGWTVFKTRLTVESVTADFVGCNFSEIAQFLRNNNYEVPDQIASNRSVKSISFTANNSIIFLYSDGQADVANCTLSGGKLSFTWKDDKMGMSFLKTTATTNYMDGMCIFKVDAEFEGKTAGTVVFALSPMD